MMGGKAMRVRYELAPFRPVVAGIAEILGSIFTVLLVLLLGLMVFTTYVMARRPLVINLREIYFFHNRAFTRAWHLIIAGMTLFVTARVMAEGKRLGLLDPTEGLLDLFLVLFAWLVLLAFWELIVIFQRYLPKLSWNDATLASNVDSKIREAILKQDRDEQVQFDVTDGQAIADGRPTLGSHVHLSHYRGVMEGMTQYLEARFGKLGDALIYTVGRQTGFNAASHMQAEGHAGRAAIDRFLLELRLSNVAVPFVLDETPALVRIQFAECAICSGSSGAKSPRCHYLTGAVRGLFEAIDKAPVEARETKCCAQGDRLCQVDVVRGGPVKRPTG